MKCIKGKEISVHKSAAGWYIGCWNEEGPYCRISGYYNSKNDAQNHLERHSFWRDAKEIWFCNGGRGCLPEEAEEDTYFDNIDNFIVEKEIKTFDDAMAAWKTGQLSPFEVPNYINSQKDAKVAYDFGLLDKAGFKFFASMEYDNPT